jgi:hypothetical protein
MRTAYLGVAALALLTTAVPLSADDKKDDDKLAPLARFAGEWTVEGKWADGNSLHARSVYEWGLGKKIMTAKTFVMNGEKEYQRYEGVLAWRPEKKSLYEISFAFDGAISEYLIESKDKDTLLIGWKPYTEGKESKVRQTIRFLDRDQFQWVVELKNGEEWKQLIDATWKRKAK